MIIRKINDFLRWIIHILSLRGWGSYRFWLFDFLLFPITHYYFFSHKLSSQKSLVLAEKNQNLFFLKTKSVQKASEINPDKDHIATSNGTKTTIIFSRFFPLFPFLTMTLTMDKADLYQIFLSTIFIHIEKN